MKTTGTKRRFAWLLVSGLTAAMIACGIVLMRLAAQPHWRTYRFPADPKTGIAVAVDYPDTWIIQNIPNVQARQFPSVKMSMVSLQLRQPTGLAKWWKEHILPHGSQQATQPQIGFLVMSNQPAGELDMMEQAYKAQGSGLPLIAYSVVARVKHPLGPAVKAEIVYNLPQRGVQRQRRVQASQVMIEPDDPRLKRQMMINVHYIGPTDTIPGGKNRLQEIIRRVHLIGPAGGATK